IVKLLAERVRQREREAVGETPGERGLQRVIRRDSQVGPGIGDAAVLGKWLQGLGDGAGEIRERQAYVGEEGLSLRQCGRTGGLAEQRTQYDILQRDLIGKRTGVPGARQEVSAAAAIRDAEG